MELLFHHVVEDPQPYLDFSGQMAVPEKLCAQFIRPDKEEALWADTGQGSLKTHKVCEVHR